MSRIIKPISNNWCTQNSCKFSSLVCKHSYYLIYEGEAGITVMNVVIVTMVIVKYHCHWAIEILVSPVMCVVLD